MAVEQTNFALYTYVDDNAVSWNKRGEKEAVRQAVDGSAAPGGNPPFIETSNHKVRKIIYVDPTTFRKKTVIFYTAAAFAAITLGTSTLTFNIPGSATGVTYTASKKIGEKNPSGTATAPGLPEHA